MKSRTRLLLSQATGITVGLFSCLSMYFLEMKIMAVLFPLIQNSKYRSAMTYFAFIFAAVAVFVLGISIWLWRRLLVRLEFLSPEEAKGYPFSSPDKD